MKRLFAMLATVLAIINVAYAYDFDPDFESEGIYYRIISDYDVEVTTGANKYFGDIKIPTLVTNSDIDYNVTKINSEAFTWSKITSIEIPESVVEIGNCFTYGCLSLQNITVSTDNLIYASEDGVLYNKDLSVLIAYPNAKASEFTVPSSVKSIKDFAFMTCYSLKSIEIPESVIEICDDAFYNTSLTSIKLPSSLTWIGTGAFAYCTSLISVELPSSSVPVIYYQVFAGCSSLTKVISHNPEPAIIKEDVFYRCPLEAVYVPSEAVEAYKVADGWSEFNIIGISNVGNTELSVYVASDILENGTTQDTREEVSFDFVEYSEVYAGQGTATLTRQGSSEVVNLPAAQIAGETNEKVRAVRVAASDGKDYQVVQPLGDAATADGIYTINFPEGYFLLGAEKEKSPAFTMSFTVGDVASITDAVIDVTDAEYYTLQGTKVSGALTPGIYICRKGDKATKLIVK